MRKVSKSRGDDDVVSSTNGSFRNEQPEADQTGGEDENKTANEPEEAAESLPDASFDTSKGTTPRKKSKRKSTRAKNNDNDEEDDNTDAESVISKESPKKTPKSKAKGKAKKKKASKTKEVEAEEEYEVERIVDSKRIKGKVHYLIRWKGYNADSDSWEPHDTLSCPDIINKFNEEKENPVKKGTKRKSPKKQSKVPAKKTKTDWDSENADENAEYEVERILEVHHKKNGSREFLIHWKGWSNKFDSWEPENNLNCSELIKKFMDKVNSARLTEGRSLRLAPETTNRFTLQAPSSGRRLSKRKGQRQRVRYDNAE